MAGTGPGGTGLTLGPLAGQLLAERIPGQPGTLELAPYALLRGRSV